MNKPVSVKVQSTDPLKPQTVIKGVITGTFGKSGKQKVQLEEEVTDPEML